ncbi:MAG: TonB-dependent receptor, partial [Synergistaceae bacterium]|nr:TonB-dependent receptor [Synergistaceae bacterium]
GSVRGTSVMSDNLKVTVGYTRTQETGDIKTRLADPATGKYDHATDYRGNDYLFRVEKGPWSLLGEFGDFKSEWDYTNSWTGLVENDRQENKYTRLSLNYADGINTGRVYYHQNKRDIFDSSGETNYGDKTVGASFNRKQVLGTIPFVWGLDWRREQADYENTNNPYGNNKPYDLARNGFAPYVEATIPVAQANLGVGLRYEHWNVDNGDDVNEFIPRISLNWESPSGQLWYATAGRYFAMPSFFQIFYEDSWGMSIPNPNLKPEKGWTYDIGVKDAKATHPWSIGLFYLDMKDKINYYSDPITYIGGYKNVDEYRAWGVEAQVKFNMTEKWSYTQGLTWMDAEEKSSGADWARSNQPRWKASGFLNYKDGPWLGEISMHYYGDRVLTNKVYDDADIFTVNASVAWKQDAHTLRLACVNLFDKEYYINNAGYVIPERRIIASWEYDF